MLSKSRALASAAALIFTAAAAPADSHDAPAGKVKCEGVNSCKGQSSCHSATNECAGHNACKGKGFKMMTPEECDQAKAKAKPQEDEG